MKPSGLRTTQICIMLAIGRAPEQPLSYYADDMGMDLSTLVRSIEMLQQEEFISLAHGKRREKLASLTEKGENKITDIYPLWQEAQAEFIAWFGAKRWQNYLDAMLQDEVA